MALNEPHSILHDGTPILIRQLMAEDAALYPDFLSEVTAEDLRLRFFAPMREVNHELLDKLINYDPARAMAFIAVDKRNRKMLGVVRLHDDSSGESAEFAILVRSRLKGHGVGWLLMKRMIEYLKQKGLKTVRGQPQRGSDIPTQTDKESATSLSVEGRGRRSIISPYVNAVTGSVMGPMRIAPQSTYSSL